MSKKHTGLFKPQDFNKASTQQFQAQVFSKGDTGICCYVQRNETIETSCNTEENVSKEVSI